MSIITVTVGWSLGVFYAHTPTVILVGFVLPFLINAFEFTLRTIKEYRKDLADRAESVTSKEVYAAYEKKVGTMSDAEARNVFGSQGRPAYPTSYTPTLTIGHIFARLLGIFTPFINFIVMICNMDRVFEWIGDIFSWLGDVFSIPLVPKR